MHAPGPLDVRSEAGAPQPALDVDDVRARLVGEGWRGVDVDHALRALHVVPPHPQRTPAAWLRRVGHIELMTVQVWLCAHAENPRHREVQRLARLGVAPEDIAARAGLPQAWVSALIAMATLQ